MSLILDALKRSRSEESAVPGVDTYHAPSEQGPAWRAYLPWAGLAMALLLIAWLLLERFGAMPGAAPGEEGVPTPASSNVAQRPQGAAKPVPAPQDRTAPAPRPRPVAAVPAPAPAPAPAPVAPDGVDPAVADLYRARGEQLQRGVGGNAASQDVPPPQATGKQAGAAAGGQSSRQVEEQPVDLETMLQQAQAEIGAGEFVEHPAPFITSLSQQTRDPIPTILYQRHEYSGQAARASVVMNGKTLRVGGAPAAGVKLEEILPNSSILSYRGTQFRLRALNSWVNL